MEADEEWRTYVLDLLLDLRDEQLELPHGADQRDHDLGLHGAAIALRLDGRRDDGLHLHTTDPRPFISLCFSLVRL